MKTLYVKDSSNRKKEFALTTKICIENGKKVVIKEPCFPEGIPHLKRIAESQRLFAKYYKNVKISKTWIENDKLYAEFIDGIPLSDYYIKAIKNNDKEEIINLIQFHLELALGQDNICNFKLSDEFINFFGKTDVFEGKPALAFAFYDPLPENIIFRNGEKNRPCFIDYEWFFNFPVPVSLLKFRIAVQLALIAGINDIISLEERLRIVDCELSFNEGIIFFDRFSNFVYKERNISYSYLNENYEKSILQYPDIVTYSGTLYFDTGNGYSENEKIIHSFTGNEINISCQVPENTVRIRLDPIEGYGCVISNLEILSFGGIVKYEQINGYKDKNNDLVFINTDPQIELLGTAHWIKIKYRILSLSDFSHYRVFENFIEINQQRNNLVAEQSRLITECDSLVVENNNLVTERKDLTLKCDELLAERNNLIIKYPELTLQNLTLFINTGKGYSEDEKIVHSFKGNEIDMYCEIPKNTKTIRLDPIEGYGCVLSNLEILSYNGLVKYEPINGFKNGDLIFINADPQIEFYGAAFWIKIKYRITPLSDYSYYRVFENFIAINQERDSLTVERNNLVKERDNLAIERDNLTVERNNLVMERDDLTSERDGLVNERSNLTAERDGLVTERDNLTTERDGLVSERNGLVAEWNNMAAEITGITIERNALLGSRSWRFTKPFREIAAFVRRHKALRLFVKSLLSIKRNGIKETLRKVVAYKKRQSQKPLSSLETDAILDTLPYESEYQENMDFSKYKPKIKAVAFYLPQFHTIPENDKWWGKGFTEWTNTRKAEPKFKGHYQPREPHRDIGYYNLTNVETLKKQAKLAKQHGIYGFCFYLYWFSGKRLLEKPLDLFLEHSEIDINFCLCWANENWTRRWDGLDNEVLIKQNYSDDDPYKFIEDIQKYIIDRRYIKVDGIPVIIVYNPGHIPNVRGVFIKWRQHANEIGIGEIKIWICKTFGNTPRTLSIEDIVDGMVEFPPHGIPPIGAKDISLGGREANIYDYKELVYKIKDELKDNGNNTSILSKTPLYHTCMLGWDNAARKTNGWSTFAGFSLDSFYEWTSLLTAGALKEQNPFFFVNAWNEWAEGTYLEPDKKYGYANINTLSKAIFYLPLLNVDPIKQKEIKKINNELLGNGKTKICIQVHLYYLELIDELIMQLNFMPFPFHCYISTTNKDNISIIEKEFKKCTNADKVYIEILENRGRDVAPFICQMKNIISKYDYVLHIHTKKSLMSDAYGNDWREYLLKNLLGSTENIYHIFGSFINKKNLGLIYPEIYSAVKPFMLWGTDAEQGKKNVYDFLKRLGVDMDLGTEPEFAAGNMFWARTKAIKKVFYSDITQDDFPAENNQKDMTLAHAIERSWVYIAKKEGYTFKQMNNVEK